MRKFRQLLPLACLLSFAACDNLYAPAYDLTEENFPRTEEELRLIMFVPYASLQPLMGHANMISLQEISSDELILPQRADGSWSDGGTWTRVHAHFYNKDEVALNNTWMALYSGVFHCNRALEQIRKAAQENPALKAVFIQQATAEIKTLRALCYYWLLDLWGNVPVITDFYFEGPAPANLDRAAVFAFVDQELSENVPLLPLTAPYGAFNRYAGKALQAKLWLNAEIYAGISNYDSVISACDAIINSGRYTLESDYFRNFNASNEDSRENIFVIPYGLKEGSGFNFNLSLATLHPESQKTFELAQSPWNGYCTLQEFYNSYEQADRRKGLSGNQKIRGNFIAGQQYDYDGVTPLSIIYTPELIETSTYTFRETAGARVGKFEIARASGPDMENDFPLFRYADVLMMKAEALYRKQNGSSVEATELFNQIRRRAGLSDFAGLTPELMLAERGREMFYEGVRRQDLIRFGKYNEAWAFKPASEPFRNIFPIPAVQILGGGNLRQNPGY